MESIGKAPLMSDQETQHRHLKEKRASRGRFRETQWQKKLLPFMISVLSLVMLFFFTASAIQLYYLHRRIERSPELDLNLTLGVLEEGNQVGATAKDKLEVARWKTLSVLEGNALQRRYHQGNVLLMSRIWTAYLGFVTGMILALVGATFILGKLRESESQVEAGSQLWKVSLNTASPGLVLALLGTILMITTMVSHYEIKVNDGQLYTAGWNDARNTSPQAQEGALPAPAAFPIEDGDEVIKTRDPNAKDKKRLDKQPNDNSTR